MLFYPTTSKTNRLKLTHDFDIDNDHWLHPVRRVLSLNQDLRPNESEISLLVVHAISLPPGEFGNGDVERLFTNSLDVHSHTSYSSLEGVRVSSHLLIDRDGVLTQFVPFNRRAWHAGESSFQGQTQCNDFAIGVELEGTDLVPFTASQYSALVEVARALMQRYPRILPSRIVGHSDISPGRKWDPGPQFDWSKFKQSLMERA